MSTAATVFRNLYRDSVSLMQLSAMLAELPGVDRASAMMATQANLALMEESGLHEGIADAGPNDIVVAISGETDAVETALIEAQNAFEGASPRGSIEGGARDTGPRSIAAAQAALPVANLALVSTPGEYAAAEAEKALRLGLNVMIFSDHVSLDDEIRLKTLARDRGLMVMGPDCGTAIIGGAPLGFANNVRRGDIGIVAASGTGLQQVACLIDHAGCGISQAIGTGGRDTSDQVGGITMLQGMEALETNGDTRVIVLVSKPPSPDVAARIRARAEASHRSVVVRFLGTDPVALEGANVHVAQTLEQAASIAAGLSRGDAAGPVAEPAAPFRQPRFAPGQRYIRGLFCGGTLCYEALLLLAEDGGAVYSNTPLDPKFGLEDFAPSREHTCIDLGGAAFTRGRPHPMIDQRHRTQRVLDEARDPETAVILFDVVLGHGAHDDPATELAAAVEAARTIAADDGRDLGFVASVCGTDRDPQDLRRQAARLREAGVALAPSNAQAVRLAASTVHRQGEPGG